MWRSKIEFIFTYFIIVIGLSGICCLIDLIRQNTVDKLVMNSHAFATLCEKNKYEWKWRMKKKLPIAVEKVRDPAKNHCVF